MILSRSSCRSKGLDYDLDTKNSIVRTAGWLLQGQFSRMMEKRWFSGWSADRRGEKNNTESIASNYKVTEGVVIKGTLSDITPDKVYLTPKHLYSVVFAHGKVNLKVGGLKGI
jgi:hypothetical protein